MRKKWKNIRKIFEKFSQFDENRLKTIPNVTINDKQLEEEEEKHKRNV